MSTEPNNRGETGRFGERFARQFVERSLGWTVLDANWRCRFGELDLVCLDGEQLVVVEVRTRTSSRFGTALESVDRRKVRRLVRLLQVYTQHCGTRGSDVPRLDVIAIQMKRHEVAEFTHVRGVLELQ